MLSHTWTRIALSYAALVLVMGGLLAFFLGGEFERREEDALRARLTDQARAVAFAAAPLFVTSAPLTSTNKLAHDLSSLFDTRVTLIRLDGVVVGDSEDDPLIMENHAGRPEVLQALSSPEHTGTASRLSVSVGRNLLYVAAVMFDPSASSRAVGVARVAYPLTAVDEARNALWAGIALTIALVTLPAAALGVWVARSVAGPLSHLGAVARRFGEGDLTARSNIRSSDEIGRLSLQLDSTSDLLSDLIRERTEQRNSMAAVLEHMHDGIILTDSEGRIESMNPAALLLFGMAPDAPEVVRGRSLIEVTHEYEIHSALQAALRDPSSRSIGRDKLELELGKNAVSVVVTRVPAPDGKPPSGLVVLQDVTELRKLERARRDFVANISHELRTPITSIKLLAETLGTTLDPANVDALAFLTRIDVELDGLTQLVRELLQLSRIESGQVQLNLASVGVPELLERAASRLSAQAERGGLSLSVEAEDGLPRAKADAERMEQVLVNLLHNAIKFTNPGGKIVLRASRHDGGVLVSVSDTGVGIPEEDLPRIFERFYKVDKARTGARDGEAGTGLGLAIAKHIVQAHNGRIWATSRVGQGTTFSFTFPAIDS